MSRSKRNRFAWMLATVALPVTSAALTGHANAACAPAAPVNDTTVTCTETTIDQNPPNGFGTGNETGITINVVTGASVTATAGTGIALSSGTVTNDGSISATRTESAFGITGGDGVTVNNNGTISATSTIGAAGIFIPGTATITNTGTISVSDTGTGVFVGGGSIA